MKKYLFTILLCFAAIMSASAQRPQGRPGGRPNGGQMPNFEKFLQDRISFVTKAMKLSADDSIKFAPIYKEKLKAKGELMLKYRHQRIAPNREYADTTYTNAAIAETEYKIEDAKVDMSYLVRFQSILTPKQLYDYIQAEKRFVGSFMRGPQKPPRSNNERQK